MDSYEKRPIISESRLAPTKAINNATCNFLVIGTVRPNRKKEKIRKYNYRQNISLMCVCCQIILKK